MLVKFSIFCGTEDRLLQIMATKSSWAVHDVYNKTNKMKIGYKCGINMVSNECVQKGPLHKTFTKKLRLHNKLFGRALSSQEETA